MRVLSFPEHLKNGDFVLACPHFKVDESGVVALPSACYWGSGGKAKNDKGETVTVAARVWCNKCANVLESSIEYRRVRFFGGKLNVGWWAFDPQAKKAAG